MKFTSVRSTIALLLLTAAPALLAQKSGTELSYQDFVQKLAEHNLSYAAEKYNVSIAQVAVQAARALPDPELSFAAYDNQERRLRLGYGFEAELSWDIELGGKRAARKKLATASLTLAEMELQSYFRELRTEATLVYLALLRNRTDYDNLLRSAAFINDLRAHTRQAAELVKLDVAAELLRDAVTENRFEWRSLLEEFNDYISGEEQDRDYIPAGTLEEEANRYSGMDLFNDDPVADEAQQKLTVAEHQLALAKAERVMDLGVMVGVGNNSFAKNIIGPNPSHTAVKAGISVPLKFSNRYEAANTVAALEQKQAQLEYTALLRKQQRAQQALRRELEAAREMVAETTAKHEQDRRQLESAMNQFRGGQRTLDALLALEKSHRQNQRDHTAALHDFAVLTAKTNAYKETK